MREQLIRQCEIVPIEVVVRNVAAGSLSKRLGIEEGTQLPRTIIEYYLKDDALTTRWSRTSISPASAGPRRRR
jgi:phosphoribosylaminoimidazole-succinocarboxamide synthase